MRVLVTDGENRAALAVTRSLGRLGHTVVVGAARTPSLAQASRYCARRLTYPDPAHRDAAFLDTLETAVRHERIDVLLPVSEITTTLVSRERERFEPGCQVPLASAAAIQRAADKADVIRTAMRLGIPVPRTVFLERADCLPGLIGSLTFPVVVKGRRSRVRDGEHWLSSGVRYAEDRERLEHEVARRHPLEFPLLLQERIEGPGMGVFACYDQGRPVAWFSHQRLREKPPSGGVSVLSESIALCPHAHAIAATLLHEIGWHGVAMVEFKVDRRDRVPRLMEINGRFWGSLQLAIDAGVDFPAILLGLGSPAGPPPPAHSASPDGYRVGVRSRWLWGDVDSLLITLGSGGAGGRGRAVREFLKLWGKELHYENPRFSDLRPWLHETWRWIRGAR